MPHLAPSRFALGNTYPLHNRLLQRRISQIMTEYITLAEGIGVFSGDELVRDSMHEDDFYDMTGKAEEFKID